MSLKLLSLFSGIGAFEKALKNVGISYELVNFCEIDKYASAAYCAVHQEPAGKNLHDITAVNVNALPAVDLITYGFPCQDISQAGKQKGFKDEEGNLTRSGLFFNAAEIIGKCRPRIAIAENVKALTSKKFSEEFKTVLETLEGLGYKNYWQVLNAKDYGMPQNRERVFIVSIRNDITAPFNFPEGRPLSHCLKDFLESEPVADNFYLKAERIKSLDLSRYEQQEQIVDKIIQIGNIKDGAKFTNPQAGRVYSPEGLCPTLNTMQGGNLQPKIIVGNAVRKLTPLECWRLMGFFDADFSAAQKTGLSNTQLYKQAGNSICVKVLEAIFLELKKHGYL